jgi:hypothetical protein
LIAQDSVKYINWRRNAQRKFVGEEYSAFKIMLLEQVAARSAAHSLENILKLGLNKSD